MPAPSRGKTTFTARNLAKLFDSVSDPVWMLDAGCRLVWANESCGTWIGIDVGDLVGRIASAATASDDPLDRIAAALAPPVGLDVVGAVCEVCKPDGGTPRMIRYLKIGEANAALIIASSGPAIALDRDAEVAENNRLRAQIHQWRKRDAAWGGIAAAGSSKHAQRLRAQVQLAAGTFHDLSIVGPAGCGGDAIARRIHLATASTSSPGSQLKTPTSPGPLVLVEGPLMDAELLEASLSPAAAFLGGERQTDTGTACTILVRGLDETALDVQSRIEQFLNAHTGSVRLMGLLGTSVDQASHQGKLIAGLVNRLEVLSLRVEALAARVDDIPLIAAALVDSRHASSNGTAERLNRAALDRLVLYPWPGNFEELDSAIRQAMVTCTGPAIGPEHLPLAIRSFQVSEPVRQKEFIEQDLDRALEQFELRLIKSALDAAKGNRSEAARMLGISRARLLRRIDESEPRK